MMQEITDKKVELYNLPPKEADRWYEVFREETRKWVPEVCDLVARQTLEPLDYKVEVVTTAAAAIQESVRFLPDVIGADLKLPGLSGKDLLVASSSQGLDVPIIVIAQKGMEGDLIQAFRLGGADYLLWPIREAEVVSAVERVLKQVRARLERETLARQLKQTNQELHRRVKELTTIFALLAKR